LIGGWNHEEVLDFENYMMNSKRNRKHPASRKTERSSQKLKERKVTADLDELSQQLQKTLIDQHVYETVDGEQRRQEAILILESLLSTWSQSALKEKQPPVDIMQDDLTSKVILCTFGSYRLGAHNSDADIDALVLSPPHCTRNDFFSSLITMLNSDARVSHLHPVPTAYTPVIKFKMNGISIDLLYATLSAKAKRSVDNYTKEKNEKTQSNSNQNLPTSSSEFKSSTTQRHEFIIDDSHLIGLDEVGVRSLNGVRVTQVLLDIIPNLENYKITLRAIKHWATIHGLYSNVLGFLGGINWAILVACICIRYPKDPPPKLIYIFFHTYSKWKWPRPVRLVSVTSTKSPPSGVQKLPSWNPKVHPSDGYHLMPILTPSYPSMNSSCNVGRPQLKRLRQEMRQAEYIAESMLYHPKNSLQQPNAYEKLFRTNSFFEQFIHYFQVNIIARNQSDFQAWFGLCESKLRILIAHLDAPDYGIEAYPFAKFFHRSVDNSGKSSISSTSCNEKKEDLRLELKNLAEHERSCTHIASFFIALRFDYGIENVDLQVCTHEFLYKVNAWDQRRLGMDLTIEHKEQRHLPKFVFENIDKEKKHDPKLNIIEANRDPTAVARKRSNQKIETANSIEGNQSKVI